MKKQIALLMVCGFALAFAACGGEKKEASDDATNTETPAMESDTTDMMPSDTTDMMDSDTTGV